MSRLLFIGLLYDYQGANELHRTLTGSDVTCQYLDEFKKELESVLKLSGAKYTNS